METVSVRQPKESRILIVDAERSVAEALRIFLMKTTSYTVCIACDAVEAQREINVSGGFELMLLDVGAPGLQHTDSVEKLARLNDGGRILTITGNSTKVDRSSTLNSRDVRVLSKSQPATEIVDAVVGALEGGLNAGKP